MKPEEIENLYLRSLDGNLNALESTMLQKVLTDNPVLAKELEVYKKGREEMLRKESVTFGPYFAQKVIHKIQSIHEQVDMEIGFFFKKFRLAAVGVVLALLTINIIFSDELNVQSVLGIQQQDEATTGDEDEDIEAFDFSNNLTNNN